MGRNRGGGDRRRRMVAAHRVNGDVDHYCAEIDEFTKLRIDGFGLSNLNQFNSSIRQFVNS
jgi:uncharacterized Ntn-hydrolase superfamily protein